MQDINNYEGIYSITRSGRVYSHKYKRFIKPYLSKTKQNTYYKHIVLFKDKKSKVFRLHRLIAEAFIPNPENLKLVDHINRNQLDNRIKNLRWVDALHNTYNKAKYSQKNSENPSRYKGVSWDKVKRKWVVYIKINGKRKNLGRFTDEKEAGKKYNEYAKPTFGEFAVLNKITK